MGDRLSAALHAQLAKQAMHMVLDGAKLDHQHARDRPIRVACGNQAQHFQLAACERLDKRRGLRLEALKGSINARAAPGWP